jgi:hypothetical protein
LKTKQETKSGNPTGKNAFSCLKTTTRGQTFGSNTKMDKDPNVWFIDLAIFFVDGFGSRRLEYMRRAGT